MPNLIWKYNNTVINNPIDFGQLEHLAETQEYEIEISHDSNEEITDCGFYLSNYSGEYNGTHTPLVDYERVLWLANNYPGYGLSIRQGYEVTGQIDGHDGIRIVDYERDEKKDIFAGNFLEILSGDAIGEKIEIDHYDIDKQFFIMKGNYTFNVSGANYKILIDKEVFFKTGAGADYSTMIPLIYRAGTIKRMDSAKIIIKLKIPKFAQSAGSFLFDLNMQFTSLEG